ncbi:MAG: hypothetical protein QME58_09940 [Bacteroidota bacterium]|nr:hypothetical protein [Bacteroidota bacterium]
MIFKYINNKCRIITICMIPILITFFVTEASFSQDKSDELPIGTNLKWITKSDIIIIQYDLVGSAKSKYEVSVVMKKEDDPTFNIKPLTVEGDIGEGYYAGENKEIRWYYRRDFPQGFSKEGYYFEIYVKPVAESKTWLYYVLGGIAATAGIVAIVTSKGTDEQKPKELPYPPTRP